MEESFYREFSESIKSLFILTNRIDERVRVLIEHNEETKHRIEKLVDNQNVLLGRIILLETNKETILEVKSNFLMINADANRLHERVTNLEKDINNQTNKLSSMLDIAFKLIIPIIGGIILWKIGVKP